MRCNKMEPDKLKNALKILMLKPPVSYNGIKAKYKKLLVKWHPDKCKKNSEICKQKTIDIIEAYKILTEYIESYKFNFDENKKNDQLNPEEFWKKHFADDHMWGKNK